MSWDRWLRIPNLAMSIIDKPSAWLLGKKGSLFSQENNFIKKRKESILLIEGNEGKESAKLIGHSGDRSVVVKPVVTTDNAEAHDVEIVVEDLQPLGAGSSWQA
ncbi:hypothetical protein LXL04_012193 [Taraxacum kok-saghyz]